MDRCLLAKLFLKIMGPWKLPAKPYIVQANELDLAIDVYGQLLREGCTPNLVTYNILIDVHGKTGNWAEAVKVLDALESQVIFLTAMK